MTKYGEFLDIAESDESLASALMPDQAIVVKRSSNGKTAWVRFVGEHASSTPTQVPISQDCPVGTTVWVFRTGGGKGFAVTQGAMQPITRSAGAWPSQVTINSAQTYEFDAPATVTGLDPAKQYRVEFHGRVRVNASSAARASVGLVFQDSSGSSFYIDAPFDLIVGGQRFYDSVYSVVAYPKADGSFVVKPAVKWESGSFTVSPGYVTMTVGPNI